MSDEVEDLVGWLLDWPYQGETMAEEAAVLIKQLTAERDRLLEALRAIEVRGERIIWGEHYEVRDAYDEMQAIARAALKGESQ